MSVVEDTPTENVQSDDSDGYGEFFWKENGLRRTIAELKTQLESAERDLDRLCARKGVKP